MQTLQFETLKAGDLITCRVFPKYFCGSRKTESFVAKVLGTFMENNKPMVYVEITTENFSHSNKDSHMLHLAIEFSQFMFQPLPSDFFDNLWKYPNIRLRFFDEDDDPRDFWTGMSYYNPTRRGFGTK